MKKKVLSTLLALSLLLAAFPVTASAADTMTDIPADAWYTEAVEYCIANGLMNGKGGGIFDPEGTVTRAQVAQVLYNMEDRPAVDLSMNTFTDVSGGAWYANPVVWAKVSGVVNGTSGTTFSPGGNITRQDMAVIFYRYYSDFKGVSTELSSEASMSAYPDWGNVAGYAKDAVNFAMTCGMLHCEGNAIDPKSPASRAEMAQCLYYLDTALSDPSEAPADSVVRVPHGKNDTHIYRTEKDYNLSPLGLTVESIKADNPTNYAAAMDTLKELEMWGISGLASGMTDTTRLHVVPLGGYTRGGERTIYMAPEIGGNTYRYFSLPTETSKVFTKYGTDITGIDGQLSGFEKEILECCALRNGNNVSASLQNVAEVRALEIKENIANVNASGYAEAIPQGMYEAIIHARPDVSRKFLEMSQQYSSYGEFIAAFQNVRFSDNYNDGQTIADAAGWCSAEAVAYEARPTYYVQDGKELPIRNDYKNLPVDTDGSKYVEIVWQYSSKPTAADVSRDLANALGVQLLGTDSRFAALAHSMNIEGIVWLDDTNTLIVIQNVNSNGYATAAPSGGGRDATKYAFVDVMDEAHCVQGIVKNGKMLKLSDYLKGLSFGGGN